MVYNPGSLVVLAVTLNVTNITTGCENITNTTNYPNKSTTVQTPTTSSPSNASQSSRTPSPSSYSYYTPSSVTPTYSTAASLTPACNVTTIFQMANVYFRFYLYTVYKCYCHLTCPLNIFTSLTDNIFV